ncbi:MAG: endolytic transglycosylase MltG, partial [Luminiphilus sp.]
MRAVIPVIVLTAVLGAGGCLWGEQKLRSPMTVPDKPVVVAIKPGQSLASVLAEMAAAGYLDSPQLLGLWARWTGVDRQIKTGEYVLRPGLTGLEFLDVLARGEVVSYRITFPEGITLAQA